jgi:hypothetical protein
MSVEQGVVGFVLLLAVLDLATNSRLERSSKVLWAVCIVVLTYRDWRTGMALFDGLPLGAMGYLMMAPGAAGRRSLASVIGSTHRARGRDPSSGLPTDQLPRQPR